MDRWLGRRVKLINVHSRHPRLGQEGIVLNEIANNGICLLRVKFDIDNEVFGMYAHRFILLDEYKKKIEPLPLPG